MILLVLPFIFIPNNTYSQYANLFSIALLLLTIFPVVVFGLTGKNQRNKYAKFLSLFVSFIMIQNPYQAWQFLSFILFELFLVKCYNKYRKCYRLIFTLSVLPLVLSKISDCFSDLLGGYSFIGFVGISYVSFRVWQLLFEAHDNKLGNPSIIDLLYFITFLPTLSSGPIDRYNRFCEDIKKHISRSEYLYEYLIPGIKKILRGITYKFAISAAIKIIVMDKVPVEVTFTNALVYMYSYTLFLFFDFAGYSNLAIGVSYLLGVKTPENFDKPFLSHNMKEFWERWHISLSKWFGDYIFSRFVLNVIRSKKIKSRKTAVRLGYMATMTLMGLWHGFYLFYVLYGFYQGLMLILTDIYIKSKMFRKFKKSKYYDVVSRVVCFHVISFGMLIFSGYLFKF